MKLTQFLAVTGFRYTGKPLTNHFVAADLGLELEFIPKDEVIEFRKVTPAKDKAASSYVVVLVVPRDNVAAMWPA